MPFLPPNQQRQSTEGINYTMKEKENSMQFSQVRPFLVHYTQGSPRVNTIAMISGLFYGLSHENLLEFFFQKCILDISWKLVGLDLWRRWYCSRDKLSRLHNAGWPRSCNRINNILNNSTTQQRSATNSGVNTTKHNHQVSNKNIAENLDSMKNRCDKQ